MTGWFNYFLGSLELSINGYQQYWENFWRQMYGCGKFLTDLVNFVFLHTAQILSSRVSILFLNVFVRLEIELIFLITYFHLQVSWLS